MQGKYFPLFYNSYFIFIIYGHVATLWITSCLMVITIFVRCKTSVALRIALFLSSRINFRIHQNYYVNHTASKWCYDKCVYILKKHREIDSYIKFKYLCQACINWLYYVWCILKSIYRGRHWSRDILFI